MSFSQKKFKKECHFLLEVGTFINILGCGSLMVNATNSLVESKAQSSKFPTLLYVTIVRFWPTYIHLSSALRLQFSGVTMT